MATESLKRWQARIDRFEYPMLALAGLAIALYMMDLVGLWGRWGLAPLYGTLSLIIDAAFAMDLLIKVAVLRGAYLRTPWFIVDLISSLPIINAIVAIPGMGQSLRFVRSFRLFRVLRTLRTLRVLRTLKILQGVQQNQKTFKESSTFNRAVQVAVVLYTALFMVIVTVIYQGIEDGTAAMAQARMMELYLVFGSLSGMLMVIAVVRFLLPEISAHQVRTLLNVALPFQVADHFMRNPDAYNRTVSMPATIIFCDIKGFTKTVERLGGDLDTLKKHLELAMDAITSVHRDYDLIIDKFIGDAVMSFRGGDLVKGDPADHAWRVVRACLDGMRALEKLNDPYFSQMKIGGASSESALIGAFGTPSRLSYTIIGDRVNLAARLEAAVSQCGTTNLFCARTRALTKDREDILWRRFGRLRVQGKDEIMDIFEAFDPTHADDWVWLSTFHTALSTFEDGDFKAAKALFEQTETEREGGDKPSRNYIEACEGLIQTGPPEGWEPILETTKK